MLSGLCENRMNKKKLNLIFLLSAAGILLLLMALGISRANRQLSDTPIVIEQSETEIVGVEAVFVTPEPTPSPALPEEAVTLLSGREPVFTLDSETTAQRLLWAYLTDSSAPPEGETLLHARFDGELIITPAEEGSVVTDYDEALLLLSELPNLVPVRVITEQRAYLTGETSVTETENPALSAGSRILSQIGSGGLAMETTKKTYVAGVLLEEEDPKTTVFFNGRATMIEKGTYIRKDTSGEPDKKEGVRGKDQGELVLKSPMRGTVDSYFGWRDGRMHNGLDITAKAGTEVDAPGEGVVVYCRNRGQYGFTVDIDHGNGFLSRLTHLDGVVVELNQRVFAGDPVGTLENWNDGDGKPHLHYELIVDEIPLNPLYYFE